jgi:hypothetical protein
MPGARPAVSIRSTRRGPTAMRGELETPAAPVHRESDVVRGDGVAPTAKAPEDRQHRQHDRRRGRQRDRATGHHGEPRRRGLRSTRTRSHTPEPRPGRTPSSCHHLPSGCRCEGRTSLSVRRSTLPLAA